MNDAPAADLRALTFAPPARNTRLCATALSTVGAFHAKNIAPTHETMAYDMTDRRFMGYLPVLWQGPMKLYARDKS